MLTLVYNGGETDLTKVILKLKLLQFVVSI